MSKREKQRVEKAFSWVQHKLKTHYNLIFTHFVASKDKVGDGAHIAVDRSGREKEDPETFIIYYDSKNTKDRSFKILKQDALHELIHFTNWKKKDIFDEAIKYIKNPALRKHIEDRYYNAEEASTYILERAVGPFIIARYSKED